MPITHRPSSSLAVALLAAALLAPPANASGRDLWIECRDTGTVGANHSPQDYEDAIANAPGDGAEYSSCLAAIRSGQQQAALRAAGGGTPSSGGGDRTSARGNATQAAGETGDPATRAAPASNGGVTPQALGAALAAEQLDPKDYPGVSPDGAAPDPAASGEPVQLGAVPESAIDRSLSLPLPVAALAIVGLLWIAQLAGRIATRVRPRT